MAKYNTWNVKLFYLQLNKWKSGIKNDTEVTLNLSSYLTGNSNDEANKLSHKLLLTNNQVSKIRKALSSGSSANIEFWKTQMSKMQLGGLLISIFGIDNYLQWWNSKELSNTDTKKINKINRENLSIDARLNMIG